MRELPVVTENLALNFANTIDDPDGPARHDHASTYPDLVAWSVRLGAIPQAQADRWGRAAARHPDDASAALGRALALREALMAIFTAIVADAASVPQHWPELQPFVLDAVAHARLTPGEAAFDLSWAASDDLDAMLRPIAMAALDLLTGPDLGRVKRCAGCPWLFVDRSKNASRRWCAMDDCGRHEKIRRYVSRRAARRAT
jgi:predicted RNA-binding Zn ribbon-like protein